MERKKLIKLRINEKILIRVLKAINFFEHLNLLNNIYINKFLRRIKYIEIKNSSNWT